MIQPNAVELLSLEVEVCGTVVVALGVVVTGSAAVVGASVVMGASVVGAMVVGAIVVVTPGTEVTCAGR